MDAAPEARGASRPPETKVPSQAPNGPTGEGPSRPRGEGGGAVEAPEPAAPEPAAPAPAASANPVPADAAAEAAAASDAAGSDEPVGPAVSAAPADVADGPDATRSREPVKVLEDTETATSAAPEHAERPTHPEGSEVAQLPQSASELEVAGNEPERRRGMAPWQARRIRMVAAGVLMAAMGIILVVRLATQSSVLVVGVYGLALILCGVVIELSRNGRTRLGSWLLVAGLAAAFAMDWFVLP